MKFFILFAEVCVQEYVRPGPELDILRKGCLKSEFQFLDHTPLACSISREGGIMFPDFLMHGSDIPLVSERFRQILDQAGVDNLFYKRITLADKELGLRENYWLALPPRIRCLDLNASVIVTEQSRFIPPEERISEAMTIQIAASRVGNYQIFKLPPEFKNQEIIISEKLRDILDRARLENVHFANL